MNIKNSDSSLNLCDGFKNPGILNVSTIRGDRHRGVQRLGSIDPGGAEHHRLSALDGGAWPRLQGSPRRVPFGDFSYGGSLNILLFSAGLLEPGVRVRLGAQIGVMR